MQDTIAEQLARYAADLRFEDLPEAVVHEAKRRVVDALGCALGGWDGEPCIIARSIAENFRTEKGSTILGTTCRVPPDWATFTNGSMVRYLDYNDTYLSKEPSHPSDNIAAALAVAENQKSSGRELLTAIVLGYEVQCRFCDAATLRARGWDHVTYLVFSTALAAARLMRLDELHIQQAVNIAGVRSAALRQSRVGQLSHWKACTVASAARHGVFAAILAAGGMTGPAPIFEGAMGFEELVSGGPLNPQIDQWAKRGAGEDFMILKSSIKFWPAEIHSQTAIEAALKLQPQISDVNQIESILIESHGAAVDIIGSEAEKWRPINRETADHSLPYIVAACLCDGELTPRQFGPDRIVDPKIIGLAQRVKVERNPELSANYPAAAGNIVTVFLKNNRKLSERVDYPRGHVRNPLTDREIEGKFRGLAEPRLGSDRASAVLDFLWHFDEKADLSELMNLLRFEQS